MEQPTRSPEPEPSDTPRSSTVFVARQPILDRRQQTAAYELLFRDGATAGSVSIDEPTRATARVAIDTFTTMGTASVLGDHRGFLNVDIEMLASEAIEALPVDQIVLEILEDVPVSYHARCLELRQAGFLLALDDYIPGDPRESMLPIADFVKVDLTLTPPDELEPLVRRLKRTSAQLLAEKVETRDEFQRCLALGFDLFQGYYFAKPVTLSARRNDPERSALFQAFRALSDNSDLADIEACFKRHARLGLHLLRLANSAGMGARQRITTLQHAIMYLGRVQLRRWILMMLFAGDEVGSAGPLAELAAVRGRLIELLLPAMSAGSSDQVPKECAFLSGMLSLADVLLERDLGEIMDELKVDPLIREAVLEGRGELGQLLGIVRNLETGNFAEIALRLDEAGIANSQLSGAQSEAYEWLRSVYQGTEPTPPD